MPRTIWRAVGPFATEIVLLAALAGCEPPSEGKGGPTAPPLTRVEVVHPARHTVRRSVGEPGELQAFETTAIHAKIPGYVKEWTVNIGAAVKKGQVLAELSVPEREAELQQKRAAIEQAEAKHRQTTATVKVAEANVLGAQARLAEVRAGIKRAEADLVFWQSQTSRVTELVRKSTVTQSLLDETRSKLHAAESTLAEVQAQVKTAEVALIQAQAALDQARSDVGAALAAIKFAQEDARRVAALLRYAQIEAPFDGIVVRRNVDTGDLTQPGADRPPLFIIARSDIMTIRVDIPEVFAPEVNPGDRALVELQAVKGRTIEAKVTRISWALDPKVRTLRVEIDIPNPGAKLQPGLYAYATIIAEEHPNVLTLPVTAIVSDQGKDYCIAIVNSKAIRRPIQLGLSDGTQTEVVSGLDGNEAVVKANAASLATGQDAQVEQPSVK